MADILEIFVISLVGLGFFIKGLFDLKKKRVMENTPTSKVRSVAMGPVEVKGGAFATKYFTSPLLKLKCTYYRTYIQEYKKRGKSGSYVTIKTLSDGRYFYVKDDTGKILIDSKWASIDVSTNYTHYIKNKTDDKVRLFLDEQKINYKNFLGFNKSMRVVEKIVSAGQEMYVYGTAQNNPLVEDGTTTKNEDDLIITKSKGNFFIISDKKEKDILKKYNWLFPLETIGGGLLFAACIIWIISLI